MIGCFPDPYPDELLYSVSARFHKLMKYKCKTTSLALFGSETGGAALDLPQRLGYLIGVLPPGHLYTVELLINEHTLLPFQGAFLPPERLARIKSVMEHGRCGGISNRANIRKLEHFQFCRLCVTNDRKQYGQTYWHRIHQTPGVVVCHIHNVFLDQSKVNSWNRKSRLKFINADDNVHTGPIRPLDLSNNSHQALLKIAHDATWLLSQHNLSCTSDLLYKRLRSLLSDHGFATHTGKVREVKLSSAFMQYYNTALLDLIQCRIENTYNFLLRLLRSPASLQSPLEYLLLIQFLQCSAKKFFQIAKWSKPFFDGPWPCLNAASDHYRQLQIHECKIKYKEERPVGRFQCSCGFVYSRTGPDKSPESFYRYTMNITRGSVWDDLLKRLYESGELNYKEIALRLKITTKQLRMEIQRLKRCGLLTDLIVSNTQAPIKTRRKIMIITPEILMHHRNLWLRAVKETPGAGSSIVQRKIPIVQRWLYNHDREWLFANSPPRVINKSSGPVVNWAKRDAETVNAIRRIAGEIRGGAGRPIRVTHNAIAHKLLIDIRTKYSCRRLPLSMQALNEVVESSEDHNIRKILWASETYKREGIKPGYEKFLRRAHTRRETAKLPRVKDAIDRAMREIAESLNHSKSTPHRENISAILHRNDKGSNNFE